MKQSIKVVVEFSAKKMCDEDRWDYASLIADELLKVVRLEDETAHCYIEFPDEER